MVSYLYHTFGSVCVCVCVLATWMCDSLVQQEIIEKHAMWLES